MITKEDMAALFANMEENAPWDANGPLLWGYFFADKSKAVLEAAQTTLGEQGYQFVSLNQAAPDADEPDLWWLHVEKVEKHTVDSLHERNQEFYKFAEAHSIETYDGMDVGPAN